MSRLPLPPRPVCALAAVLLSFAACSEETRELMPDETELLRRLGFDEPPALAAIAAIGGPVERLSGLTAGGEPEPADGVTVEIAAERVPREIARLREILQPLGFGVYLAEQHFGIEPDRLAIVRGADPYDFLRLVRVDGINFGLEHEGVVAKLREWDQRYGLEYVGAGLDWVSTRFRSMPADMLAFAEEVNAFCPDVVDQGTGTVDALADEMRRSQTLYCWWD